MQPSALTTEMFDAIRNDMLTHLGQERPPVEVSEHGLVSIVMDTHGKVTDIRLAEDLSCVDVATLEAALIAAFNRARTEITEVSAGRLSETLKRAMDPGADVRRGS